MAIVLANAGLQLEMVAVPPLPTHDIPTAFFSFRCSPLETMQSANLLISVTARGMIERMSNLSAHLKDTAFGRFS